MKRHYLILVTAVLLVLPLLVKAQGTYLPLNTNGYHIVDRFDIQYGKVLPLSHTVIKPYSRKYVGEQARAVQLENITGNKRFEYNLGYQMRENSEWVDSNIVSEKAIWKVFYRQPANLFSVNKKGFILKVNPVLDFQLGYQTGGDELRFMNTRGAELRGYIKKKVGFYTYFTDNQMRNVDYVRQFINDREAVPGEGFYKEFRETGVDYFTARGYVTFNILEHIDVAFGHDKHFWGNGMRSLYLSDFGQNMFFLKVQTTIWRITYTNLFTELIAPYDRGLDQVLPKKYGAFHHLNIKITNWLDIGLFEGVMYDREDGLELQYFNPIIFYRAVEQAIGSPDNALVGLDYKVNIARRLSLYGQFVFDEFNFEQIRARNGWWANKFALQTGVKYINVAGIDQLDLQLEFNWVRPYMYTHGSNVTSYTHYNQPLAHPLGANFWELTGQVNYQIIPQLNTRARVMYAVKGIDNDTTNYGGNIFKPTAGDNGNLTVEQEFGNDITQGFSQKIFYFDFLATYQIRHNIFFDLNLVYRNSISDLPAYDGSAFMVNFGARMNIPHRGYMF